MEESFDVEAVGPLDAPAGISPETFEAPFDAPVVAETSAPFVGRWNRLVSQTNWEKGQIICAWRDALRAAGAPAADSTDEAWSRCVSGVSPQHVGRLRRVYERFGGEQQQYAGLYWSHFFAALDWPDAELWLEGAVQNRWSISGMRRQRWESLGAPDELKPREADILQTEFDEDAVAAAGGSSDGLAESFGEVQPADESPADETAAPTAAPAVADQPAVASPPVRPFEDLPALPADFNEALEAFKLAIVSRKLTGWQDVARDDVLAALDSLKQFALAPAGE